MEGYGQTETTMVVGTLRGMEPKPGSMGKPSPQFEVDIVDEDDLIAVIGKGHETYRDREGVKTPFLERELLEEYAQQIGLE